MSDGIAVIYDLNDDQFIYRLQGVAGKIIEKLSKDSIEREQLIELAIELNPENVERSQASEFIDSFIKDLKQIKLLEEA
tara:strand:- start:26090 stop:26326 length:237 start_codon:yes stop_codon:yes gene_type:complete